MIRNEKSFSKYVGGDLGNYLLNIPSDPDLGDLMLTFLPQQHCCWQQLLFLHRPLLIVGNGCLIHLFSPSQGFFLPTNAFIWATCAVIWSVWSEFEFVLNIQVLSPKRLYIHQGCQSSAFRRNSAFFFTFRFFQNYFPLFLKNRNKKKCFFVTDTATIERSNSFGKQSVTYWFAGLCLLPFPV